jgi:hypothetical protein
MAIPQVLNSTSLALPQSSLRFWVLSLLHRAFLLRELSMLLTHLYEFFGILTGCSTVGQGAFPAYGGDPSMGRVHQFMDLDAYQMGYFITQVGLAAASFGVTTPDVTAVGMALQNAFDYRCAAPAAIVPGSQPEIQAICVNPACPLAMNPQCSAYQNVSVPMYANGSMFQPEPSMSPSASMSMSGSGSPAATGSMSMGGGSTTTGSTPAQVTKNVADGIKAGGIMEVVMMVFAVAMFQ